MNLIQPNNTLTEAEIDTLIKFMSLPPKFEHYRFSSLARKKVLKMYEDEGNLISSSSLNNRIYAIIDKGFLTRDEDNVIYLAPLVKKLGKAFDASIENRNQVKVTFSLELMEDDTKES